MPFVALFEDDPARLGLRGDHMEAHLRYLDERRDRILVAGSLREASDAHPLGAAWIVEAPDRGAAERLCKEDPFWTCGLRRSLRVLHWSKAFPDRATPV